jgi:ribonuclease G
MSEEILMNITPMESRVAVVENGVLQEVHVERTQRRGIVGNIYKGKVVRVLPGMQAAFVDIGLDRAAFIHASEISAREGNAVEPINALVHEGQSLVVQVTKDPIGTKGARLTTQLSIPSRYLVYMPRTSHVGISLRIEDEAERERLKQVVAECVAAEGIQEAGGFILRTAAEGAGRDEILMDIRYLRRLWEQIAGQIKTAAAPTVIYEDLSLAMRTLRDLVNPRIEKIRIDSRENFQKVSQFVGELMPELGDRLEHYPGERPIFDLYGVEDEIQKALERKVMLKSGGYLIIDPAEAMTTIDVNTGAFVGHRTLEETIFKTNLESATAIARQLRLRNLGGIIIIDFIDMDDAEHRRQVLRTLEKALARDHAKTTVYEFSPLGLVEMTRKRTVESLERQLSEPCPECSGRGSIKTAETVTYEIFREITRAVRQFDAARLLVIASSKVVARITDEESAAVAELEEFLGKSIRFQADEQYLQEQFDVVLL